MRWSSLTEVHPQRPVVSAKHCVWYCDPFRSCWSRNIDWTAVCVRHLFSFPAKYIWYITLCKCKVCNTLIWCAYILWYICHCSHTWHLGCMTWLSFLFRGGNNEMRGALLKLLTLRHLRRVLKTLQKPWYLLLAALFVTQRNSKELNK